MHAQKIKLLLSLTFIVLFHNVVFSQNTFQWQVPLPTGHFYSDVQLLGNGSIVAVGNEGTFIRSDDGGQTWAYHYTQSLASLQEVHFTDALTGYVAGTTNWYLAPKVMKTVDGGVTWDTLATDTLPDIYAMYFISADTGWVAGLNGSIFRTNDGGLNWINQSVAGSMQWNTLVMLNSDTGFVAGSDGYMSKTTDGGFTWSQPFGASLNHIYDLFFIDSQHGWLCGVEEVIKRTIDGGASWQLQHHYIGGSTEITSIVFLDSLNGFAASQPYLYHTDDGGVTWNDENNFYHQPVAADIDQSGNGILVGVFGSIQTSSDSGSSWNGVAGASNFYDFNSITFSDKTHGWCVGDGGKILRTTDGVDWMQVNVTLGLEFQDVCFLNNQVGYVVGESGAVRKTINGGTNWTNINTPGNEDLYSVFFLNANVGWVGGWSSTLYKTTNGGTTWTPQTLPTFTYMVDDIFFLNADTGFIAAWGSKIYKTVNGGAVWTEQLLSIGGSNPMNIQFVNKDTGYISTSYGMLSKTMDGGQTWSTPIQFNFSPGYAMHFFDANNGFVAGGEVNWDAKLFRTSDGGTTWQNTHIPFAFDVTSLYMSDTNSVYLCGEWGNILHYGDSISPVISDVAQPENHVVGFSIYPNPATTQFSVLSDKTLTSLKISDVSGHVIISAKCSSSEILVNASSLPNGSYIITATTISGEQMVKKIQVLK